MKKIIVMLLFAAFMPVFAQNLLDNSSFESIDEQKKYSVFLGGRQARFF